MKIFSRWRTTKVPAIEHILVRKSDFEGVYEGDLLDAVTTFVNRMVGEGEYRRANLPDLAFRVYSLDYYICQVNNGGHKQYIRNSGWNENSLRDVEAGLAALGVPEATAIFNDLLAFACTETERFLSVQTTDLGAKPREAFIDALDDRFFSIVPEPRRQLSDWLHARPEIEAVPDDAYEKRLAALIVQNPLRESRAAEAQQQAAEDRERNPIIQALTMLVAAPGRKGLSFLDWQAGSHTETPDGDRAWVVRITTTHGPAKAFFYSECALLWMDGEESICANMDSRALDNNVIERTGRSFAAMVGIGR